MGELITRAQTEIVAQQSFTEDLFTRFVAYLDASPKTVQTYTRAVRQFFSYIYSNGIKNPTETL